MTFTTWSKSWHVIWRVHHIASTYYILYKPRRTWDNRTAMWVNNHLVNRNTWLVIHHVISTWLTDIVIYHVIETSRGRKSLTMRFISWKISQFGIERIIFKNMIQNTNKNKVKNTCLLQGLFLVCNHSQESKITKVIPAMLDDITKNSLKILLPSSSNMAAIADDHVKLELTIWKIFHDWPCTLHDWC